MECADRRLGALLSIRDGERWFWPRLDCCLSMPGVSALLVGVGASRRPPTLKGASFRRPGFVGGCEELSASTIDYGVPSKEFSLNDMIDMPVLSVWVPEGRSEC